MDDTQAPRPVPGWFTVAAAVALLWEVLGCVMFVSQLRIDPALVDSADRAVLAAAPQWMIAAYGVAVVTGVLGALLLLLRRRLAVPLLAVSLVAVVVQDSAYLLAPALRNLTASDDLFLPFLILVVCYSIWHFARAARKSGWLR
jgi:hypothetical protein